MPRIKFAKTFQTEFLNNVKEHINVEWSELAQTLGVRRRTLSDWRREICTLPENIFKNCIELTGGKLKIPAYQVLPDFWNVREAARQGGLAVTLKPGTLEGRRKGGVISQVKRGLHPELYQHCNLRKEINIPENNAELAEFVGIVFGDGGINNDWQVVITLNSIADAKYADYVSHLVRKLFKIDIARRKRPGQNALVIVVSSTTLVEFLIEKGAVKGNKIRQQIDIPAWIKNNPKYQKAFVRGLVDTDGCLYIHRHITKGSLQENIGFCFTSCSPKLIHSVAEILKDASILPHITDRERRIYLYSMEAVKRYLNLFGSSNSRILDKYAAWQSVRESKNRRISSTTSRLLVTRRGA